MTARSARLAGFALLVSGLWTGALLFFATGGAGTVLETSPSRGAAGPVNRALLDLLDVESYGAIAVLLGLVLLAARGGALSPLARAIAVRVLVVALGATIASHLVVTPQMASLRGALGAIDLVPREDARRALWGRLHGFSAALLLVRIAAGAAVFLVVWRETARRLRITDGRAPAAAALPGDPASAPASPAVSAPEGPAT